LIKPDVNESVLELAGFLAVGAYDHAEKQVAAACVINDNRQLTAHPFPMQLLSTYKNSIPRNSEKGREKTLFGRLCTANYFAAIKHLAQSPNE
jgi:hypothetical protein